VLKVIVDISEFRGRRALSAHGMGAKEKTAGVMSVETAACDRHMTDAQLYDLGHHRRLKALDAHLEGGATLSEAARMIGVSHMTAYRWNDHGRR
jgi:hypothetical protein